MSITVEWSEDDEGFVAVDASRPGCCAWGETESAARRELQDAQAAWDDAITEYGRAPTIVLGQFGKKD